MTDTLPTLPGLPETPLATEALKRSWTPDQAATTTESATAALDMPSFGPDFMKNWALLQWLLRLDAAADRFPGIVRFEAIRPDGAVITIEPGDGRHKGLAFAYWLFCVSARSDAESPITGYALTARDQAVAAAFFTEKYTKDEPGTGKHAMIDALLLSPVGTKIVIFMEE